MNKLQQNQALSAQNNTQSGGVNSNTFPSVTRHPYTSKNATKKHSKEQELFLQLLHNYPDGLISLIDRQYNFIYTGGELHKRLAANPAELIGNKIYPKFPETVRDLIRTQLEKVFEGNRISAFELPGLVKGEYYIMDAFPIKEKLDFINYAGVIIRNISHLKTAEEELKISLKKERELGELKSRFITMASHEFKTPLSTMLTSVQLLKNYTTTDTQEKRDKHIGRIISSVNHLTDILNDFLTVGNLQEGNMVSSPVTFNIKDHMEMIIAEFENDQHQEKQIFYNHRGKELVELDPVLLKNITTNILSNAIKFSPENSPVEINTKWVNDRLVLLIKDYGIGIPPEYRNHLFEQFYRASNAMNIPGTGLGLHLVSKYAALMNGTILYRSELEKGTEFLITF